MPEPVEQCLEFLRRNSIWHLTSQNAPAHGCAQAAEQRHRLGGVGIPLCDELKSLLYAYAGKGGHRRYVLLHCRGHQRLDPGKASAAVGATLLDVGEEELATTFGAQYGTVTPALFARHADVRQIVDETVMARFFAPYTMMTNGGHLEYAVELRPRELFGAIPQAAEADIVVEEDKRVPRQTLGILTGNSAESGILLWEKINERIRNDPRVRFRGDAGLPRVVIDSVPGMGASMELPEREPDVRPVVLDAVEGLCRAGATAIGVACNTTQYFAPDVRAACERHGARFVSLPEETRKHLERSGVATFDLLGIGAVTDLDGWSDFGRVLEGFDVRVPAPRHVGAITDLAFRVKQEVVSPSTVNRLRDLVNRSTETETVVLALTELSILFSQNGKPRSGKHFIDTLDVLAESMAEIYLQERIATGGA